MEQFWQFIAGLGIFLYATFLLEDALEHLSGRAFKLFLRKHTGNKFEAILSGALITAALQSSSVVILMTLAFVGAGVIGMRNALAVVLGANFGTTISNWIMVTLGFKFDIELVSFPLIGLAGITLVIFSNRKKIYHAAHFLLGFGFLFLGLGFMKDSIGTFFHDFDFTPYTGYPVIVFVLIGFLITALIQASSATMVIALSALYTGTIPFDTAVAVVIGSELGTSVKIILGSINGIASKKRIALGNVLFNVVISLVAYAFMYPLIRLIQNAMGIQDPLIALVMFQSLINLVGVILFVLFLDAFSRFLEKRYAKTDDQATLYIGHTPTPETAIVALEKESIFFIYRVLQLNLDAFHVTENMISIPDDLISETEEFNHRKYSEKYETIKQAEGEILSFYFKLQKDKPGNNNPQRLEQLVASVRNAMYSAKSIKDVRHNRKDFRNSADDTKYGHYKFFQAQLEKFYQDINTLLHNQQVNSNALNRLLEIAKKDYDERTTYIYQKAGEDSLEEADISTMLNVSRELYNSAKAITYAIRDSKGIVME